MASLTRAAMAAIGAALALLAADAEAKTFRIEAGPGAQAQLLAAAQAAEEGDEIAFGAGRFDLDQPIRITARRVALRGRGADRTILSFARQTGTSPALELAGERAEVADLAIEEAPADGLVLSSAIRAQVRDVRVAWSGLAPRGANGIVAQDGEDVVVSRVRVERAAAGGVALRRIARARIQAVAVEMNRVGVVVESSADVTLSEVAARGNGAGGLLLGAPAPRPGAARVRIVDSAFERSAPVAIERAGDPAALAPQGAGLVVLGYSEVWVERNVFAGSSFAHVFAGAYPQGGRDAGFIAIPQDVQLRRNAFGALARFAAAGDYAALGEAAQADVVWDGAESWIAGGRPRVGVVRIGFDRNDVRGNREIAPGFKTLALGAAGAPLSEAAPRALPALALVIAEPRVREPEG